MLAKRRSDLPEGEGWIFEPKWDGFRALVFRDGDELFIQSRDEKPLGRYFPELEAPLRRHLPDALRRSTARSSSPGTARSTSRRCSCASTPRRRA